MADPHGIHPVAFRAPDLETEMDWRGELLDQGVDVTEMRDRQYFKSIYFREPGGVLFEIATDEPGFTVDEPLLELGRTLKLPPWLEPSREQIQRALPDIEVPSSNYPQTGLEASLPVAGSQPMLDSHVPADRRPSRAAGHPAE